MTKARDLADFIANGTIAQTVTADGVDVGDNERIRLGDSQDLQLFHNGSASYITDSGTGNLVLQTSSALVVQNSAGTETMLQAFENGAVNLYYDNSVKIATASTGADVTGTNNGETNVSVTNTNTGADAQVRTKYTTDGGLFTVGKTSDAHAFGGDAYIHNVDNTNIRFSTSDTERMRIDSSGNVGIGTSSPQRQIHSVDSNGEVLRLQRDGPFTGSWDVSIGTFTTGDFTIYDNENSQRAITVEKLSGFSGNSAFYIGSAGQLGIGGATYGTSGQVLTSGGSGAAPTWADAAGGSEIVRVARTSNTALTSANVGNLIDITSGTFTQTFDASSSLANGWFVYLRNSGTGVITLDPNSTETIDGLSTFALYPGDTRIVQCDGSNLRTIMLKGGTQTYTSSGTFIVPPHVTGLIVDCWGGGGGGGAGHNGDGRSGAGGGGGAHAQMKLDAITAGTSVTVTVGAGGNGGTGAGGYGGTGGTSSFGTYIKAYGGNGPGPHGGGGAGSHNSGTQGQVLNEYSNQGYPTVNISSRTGGQFQQDGTILSMVGGGGAYALNGAASSARDGYSAEWGGGSGAPYVSSTYGGRGGSSIYGGGGGGAGGGNGGFQGGDGGATNAWQQGGGGAGGTSGNAGSAGADGSGLFGGQGGGGGGDNGVGGNGGFPSGGGGGGGKGDIAGGDGGDGKVVVTYF